MNEVARITPREAHSLVSEGKALLGGARAWKEAGFGLADPAVAR